MCPLPIQVPHLLTLLFLLLPFVVVVVVAAVVVVGETVVAAEVDVAETADADAADADVVAADAASGNEFEVVETVVQLKECAWPDCWDRIVAPHHVKQSS